MQNVSSLFSRLSKEPFRVIDSKVLINGAEINNTNILGFEVDEVLCDKDDVAIGAFNSSILKLNVFGLTINVDVNIGDLVQPYVRFKNISKLGGEDDYSEYLLLGNFYVDSMPVAKNNMTVITCYDEAIYGDVEFTTESVFPITMQDMFNQVNAVSGFTLDASVVINPTYTVDYYNNTEPYTAREIIGYIAGCHGANALINRDGNLEFRKLLPDAPQIETVGLNNMFKYEQTNPIRKVTNLIARGQTESFQSGSDLPSETLYTDNPFMNQTIADDVALLISDFAYLPITLDWVSFPYVELGDRLNVEKYSGFTWTNQNFLWSTMEDRWDGYEIVNKIDEDKYSMYTWSNQEYTWSSIVSRWDGSQAYTTVVLKNKIVVNGGLSSTIQNNGLSLQENEYILEGALTRKVKGLDLNAVKQSDVYYGVRINKENGIEVTRTDMLAKAKFNADTLSMQKGDGIGGYTDAIYFDVLTGKYKFIGDIEASGTITGASIIGSNINNGSGTFLVDALGNVTANSLVIGGGSGIANLSDAGNLATKDNVDLLSYGEVLNAGALATKDKVDLASGEVLNAGALAYLNAINGTYIDNSAITTPKIATGAVDASKINVLELSAITANLGTVNAGTINGVTMNGSTINGGTVNIGTTAPIQIYSSSGVGIIDFPTSGTTIADGTGFGILSDTTMLLQTFGSNKDISIYSSGDVNIDGDDIIFGTTPRVSGFGNVITDYTLGLELNSYVTESYADTTYCTNASSSNMSFQVFGGALEVFANGIYQGSATLT